MFSYGHYYVMSICCQGHYLLVSVYSQLFVIYRSGMEFKNCHILHNLHASINFIITDSQLSTYFWVHPISNCGWVLYHYTCMLSIAVSLMYIWCCGSREEKTPVTVWWLHACTNSTPYLSFSAQYTYHQECIRESTQEHTVVWQVRFNWMTSQWLHQVQDKYKVLDMNNIIVMHSCNG